MTDVTEHAEDVYVKYVAAYGSNLQGCCPLIADEIIAAMGGVAVAGYLTWFSRSCRRQHWWVVVGDEIIDPMGEEFLRGETATGREEVHRDQVIFRNILPRYEQWRV